MVIVVLAVTYNGILAFLNAHGLYVSRSTVVITEILILSSVGVAIVGSGARNVDRLPLLFFALFLANALAVSLFTGAFFIEMARNAAIISAFIMLGARLSPSVLARSFLISAVIVFLVLLIEIVSVEAYAELFSPGAYFEQTRGLAPSEFDDLGLFGNALGWDERFSIFKIINHRAASIFLEQVSLANFGIVLAIYLCCRWSKLPRWQKLALPSIIALVVVTTASRTALGLVLLAPAAYWLAPKLNRFSTFAILPAVFAIALVITGTRPLVQEDNLEGRLGYTIRKLGTLDLSSIFGFRAIDAPSYADSGYMYVIVGSTLLGLFILSLFVCLIAIGRTDALKRCSLLLSLYVFCNLMVSGTSIFSIKTAALLWLLVGFLRDEEQEPQREEAPTKLPDAASTAARTSNRLAPR